MDQPVFAVVINGMTVFFSSDPRLQGFRGELEIVASEPAEAEDVFCWKDGHEAPRPELGFRDGEFKLFRDSQSLREAGFERRPFSGGVFADLVEFKVRVLGLKPTDPIPERIS